MNPVLLFPLAVPWGIGPSPSAHEVSEGVAVSAELSALSTTRPQAGGRAAVSYTPHPRLWTELSLQHGPSWQTCIDCGTSAAELKLRGTLVRHQAFQLAPWVVGQATPGALEGTLGAAMEGGTRRLRFDTSWPILTSHELLTYLRIMPEAGVSWAWSDTQSTRVAAIGLEPTGALQHRSRLGDWTVVSTLRLGEEGPGARLGLTWRPK